MVHWVVSTGLGAAAGYGWYRVVGCGTGTCPITARWWTATLYGAALGAMVAGGGA
ncbi:MAG: DUF6132 family protein [Myxococcota bacterium]